MYVVCVGEKDQGEGGGSICCNSCCDLLDANLKNTRLHFKGQLYSHEKQRLSVFDTNERYLFSG